MYLLEAYAIEAPWQTALPGKTQQIPTTTRNVGLQIRLIGVRYRTSHRALSPMKTIRACCMRRMNLSRPDSIRRPLDESTWASPPPTRSTSRKAGTCAPSPFEPRRYRTTSAAALRAVSADARLKEEHLRRPTRARETACHSRGHHRPGARRPGTLAHLLPLTYRSRHRIAHHPGIEHARVVSVTNACVSKVARART